MSYLIFKNNLGEINFSGSGDSDIAVREITGLGTPDRIYQTREYLDFDGQITLSSHFSPRTITISFDVVGGSISQKTAEIYRILSQNGNLYTFFNNSRRRIEINQISVESFIRHGSRVRSFAVQFVCDNPYFSDHSPIYESCYETLGKLVYDGESESWNLDVPSVWGTNSNDKFLINSGDIKSYPIFTVCSSGNAADSNGFEILRVNPDNPAEIIQKFTLNYPLSDGETVTVCFDSRSNGNLRSVTNNLGENLLSYRSEESSLSDFWIDPGKNRIILNNLSGGNSISAYISYENQYIEGVF